tara:strand:+ start:5374 stop:6210 length:837 start_codon:yes stop_codon:yes gene_type:complete
MILYKKVNIILAALSLLVLIFYDDTQERDTNEMSLHKDTHQEKMSLYRFLYPRERSLYNILYILYLTHVCGLLLNIDINLHIIILFLGIITVFIYILSAKKMRYIYKAYDSIYGLISNSFWSTSSLPIQQLKNPQVFEIANSVSQFTVDFMIYLDVINRNYNNNAKVPLLTFNQQCPIIQYNGHTNTYDIVQYNCESENRYSIPIKYMKWTRFRIEFVKGLASVPLYIRLQIDDDLVYSNTIHYGDTNQEITNITIGDNNNTNNTSIGFVKNILIDGT